MERVRLGSRCWGMPELPVWRSLSFPTGMELAQGEKGDGEHSRPLFIEPLELYHVFRRTQRESACSVFVLFHLASMFLLDVMAVLSHLASRDVFSQREIGREVVRNYEH